MPTSIKRIEYRYVVRLHPFHSLGDLIRKAWEILPNPSARTFPAGNGSSLRGLATHEYDDGSIAIQIVNYTDRQSVGVLSMDDSPENEDVGERPPDEGTNFLSGDMFAVISNDHLVTMNVPVNSSRFYNYLINLFSAANLGPQASQFTIQRRTDADKLAMIERFGVKRIDLKTGLQQATLDRIQQLNASPGMISQLRAKALEAVRAVMGNDEEYNLSDSENGYINLSLNLPKREIEEIKEDIDEIARSAVENEGGDDQYVIHLGNGEQIKSNEVVMRSSIRVEKHANTVQTGDAWNKMHDYLRTLILERQHEM